MGVLSPPKLIANDIEVIEEMVSLCQIIDFAGFSIPLSGILEKEYGGSAEIKIAREFIVYMERAGLGVIVVDGKFDTSIVKIFYWIFLILSV
jgi:hypothetical protein